MDGCVILSKITCELEQNVTFLPFSVIELVILHLFSEASFNSK